MPDTLTIGPSYLAPERRRGRSGLPLQRAAKNRHEERDRVSWVTLVVQASPQTNPGGTFVLVSIGREVTERFERINVNSGNVPRAQPVSEAKFSKRLGDVSHRIAIATQDR